MVIGGFAGLTMLTKNSFLDQINKQYVVTARAKGLTERRVLYGHVFRNAMLIVIAGFPAAFVGILFTGALLIEVIFSLDGLGLLGFEAAINRDYPVMFGTLYFFTLLGLVLKLIEDLTYVLSIRASTSSAARSDRTVVPILSPLTRRRLAQLPRQPARLLVAVDLPRALRGEPRRRADRQRPAAARPLRRQLLLPGAPSPTRRPPSAAIFPTEADYRDPTCAA